MAVTILISARSQLRLQARNQHVRCPRGLRNEETSIRHQQQQPGQGVGTSSRLQCLSLAAQERLTGQKIMMLMRDGSSLAHAEVEDTQLNIVNA